MDATRTLTFLIEDINLADSIYYKAVLAAHYENLRAPITPCLASEPIPDGMRVTADDVSRYLTDNDAHGYGREMAVMHPCVPVSLVYELADALTAQPNPSLDLIRLNMYAVRNRYVPWDALRAVTAAVTSLPESHPLYNPAAFAAGFLENRCAPPDLLNPAIDLVLDHDWWLLNPSLLVTDILGHPNAGEQQANRAVEKVAESLVQAATDREVPAHEEQVRRLLLTASQIVASGGWEFGDQNELTAGGRLSSESLSRLQTALVLSAVLS